MMLSDNYIPTPSNFPFPKIQTNPGHYTTVIPNEGIPDTGYPFKTHLNPCSHSIHSNAFSCALAAKPLSQPKCILLPWISWHKLVQEWRMQSVPSHFSTCTNTRDLEMLHKFLLTSYRQSLNGLKRANCWGDNTSPFSKETSNALCSETSPLWAGIKALLLSQQSSHDAKGNVSTATSPVPSCSTTKTNWTGQSTSHGLRKALMLEEHSELTSRNHCRQEMGPWETHCSEEASMPQTQVRKILK